MKAAPLETHEVLGNYLSIHVIMCSLFFTLGALCVAEQNNVNQQSSSIHLHGVFGEWVCFVVCMKCMNETRLFDVSCEFMYL